MRASCAIRYGSVCVGGGTAFAAGLVIQLHAIGFLSNLTASYAGADAMVDGALTVHGWEVILGRSALAGLGGGFVALAGWWVRRRRIAPTRAPRRSGSVEAASRDVKPVMSTEA